MTDQSQQTADPQEAVERIEKRFEAFHRFIVTCGECQAEMPADWHYCTDCGNRLSTECPACNQPLPPVGARFCPHCGFAIPHIAPFGQESDEERAKDTAKA